MTVRGNMLDKKDLSLRAQETEKIIYSFLPETGEHDERITEAVSYSVTAGGKRLRPILMQETFRMFNHGEDADTRMLSRFMAAIEFIHTYSLVHDDLPAMDNDELRRGKPTTHAVYGEAFGVLAGDALLNLAFEVIAEGMSELTEETENCAEALRRSALAFSVLASKAGIHGMIGGQCLDVFNEKSEKDSSLPQICYIYENKTGALLEAAAMVGAILAGASKEQVKLIEEMASNVGYAFQIRDDILDITSTTEQLGKPVGSDEKNGKETYATLKGMEEAQKDVEEYSRRAVEILESLPENKFLEDLVKYLITREN